MIDYKVSIEKSGQRIVVGSLTGENSADTRFTYDAGYLASEDAQAISVNLPLTGTTFSAEQTRLYFEGLLPEGYIRMSLADSMHFEQEDYVSLLHVLGCECLGAIMISDENEEYDASYEALSKKQLSDFAKEGASKSVELVKKSRLSLAGASGKAGLYYDEKKGKWYLPVGTAPSTHIVKQSHVRLDALVLNEQLCMLTAKLCGIDVPSGFVVNTGSGLDDSVLFAAKRYDRVFAENSVYNKKLPVPLRLHQEDFAQALGIPTAAKYEMPGDNYIKKMFDLLRAQSSNPVEDIIRLWDRIVFNCLIGNADAHLKNYSLLYGSDLSAKRLAPAYDIVSTAIYESSSPNLSVIIGSAKTLDELKLNDFRDAADMAGIGRKLAMEHLDTMIKKLPKALDEASQSLNAQGFSQARRIAGRIKAKARLI